jgi:signal transduction histidine kinase
MRAETVSIMVAGDDEIEGVRLSKHLAQLGHDVLVADSEDDAILLVRNHRPDLVFLDLTLPEFSNSQILAQLKVSRTVVLLPEGQLDLVSQALEMGADDFLFKPFNLAMLQTRLNVWLDVFGSLNSLPWIFHELKAPLSSIKGYSDLLLTGVAGKLVDQQTNFISTIRANAYRMVNLMSHYADLVQVESKYLYLTRQPVALGKSIIETLRSFHRALDEKHQKVLLGIPENLPLVQADETSLRKVLATLIGNASKYSPDEAQIAISANEWVENPGFLLVSVQDNGIGIQSEEQENVFTKWWRSEHDKIREQAGNGLSLYIAKHLIEAQGGRIWFESEFGKGTTFHFTIPVVDASST